MFDKILIANRGEIACRVLRTCQRMGVRTVAVYSEADAGALFTRQADEAYLLGGAAPRDSYLHMERILEVARRAGAQAIHPGYGFLSENPAFARACQAAGVRFIGPSPEAMEAMGLKHAAKALMERAGVPVVPGYHGDDQSDARLAREAERIGFPVLIKAVAGGGGKGMRQVESAAQLPGALMAARREAESSFGDARVLIEKYLATPRHIEVQVLADGHGRTLSLFERDCSLQRRHQKLVEEAPAPHITPALREALGQAAVRAAQAVDYQGAGTVEMIVDASQELSASRFYFMEMNTRLQVEHPVTELITGLDLVEWQLRIAAGEPLCIEQSQLSPRGHALEVRLCAEDPAQDFAPRTGPLLHVAWPSPSAQVRVETGVVSGDTVTPHYDSMLAKLVVWGEDRAAALRLMERCLAQVELVGVEHNTSFLRAAVAHLAFRAAQLHTGFLAQHRASLLEAAAPAWAHSVVLAAMGLLCARAQRPSTSPHDVHSPWSSTRAFRVNAPQRDVLHFRLDGREVQVEVLFAGPRTELRFDGQAFLVERAHLAHGALKLWAAQQRLSARFLTLPQGTFLIRQGHVAPLRMLESGAAVDEDEAQLGAVKSPLPGRISSVFVRRGQAVQQGDALVSLEAMKMEHTLRASVAGVVSELSVEAQEQVVEGSTLLVLSAHPAKE